MLPHPLTITPGAGDRDAVWFEKEERQQVLPMKDPIGGTTMVGAGRTIWALPVTGS